MEAGQPPLQRGCLIHDLRFLKGKIMRALRSYSLALVLVVAGLLSASGPASFAAASAQSVRIAPADCPAGTNWDYITQSCV